MPTSFVITAASTTVVLDAARTGTATLTVSNTTGRPVRTRLVTTPSGDAKAAWATIEGGDLRDLALGGSVQVVVRVAVPADVPAGTYALRLDAIADDQPEEAFAHGPDLQVQVPAAVATKPFPWWIVVVAAVLVLLIGGGTIYALTRPGDTKVAVPAVAGQPLAAASKAITDAGFQPQKATVDGTPDCDQKVQSTAPAAGARPAKGSVVLLVVPPLPANRLLCLKIIPLPEAATKLKERLSIPSTATTG